jgi:hypothetical protein
MNDSQGYTKHYYAGSERIASKIGGGGIIDIVAIIRELLANMSAWKLAFEYLDFCGPDGG